MTPRVLIIESDPAARASMVALFDPSTCDAVAADDHLHALSLLQTETIDVVVTDLPRSSPVRAARNANAVSPDCVPVRAAQAFGWVDTLREHAPGVPIVLIIKEGNERVACESLLRGAASYVPRKLAKQNLLETVHQVLSVSRAAWNATDMEQCITQVKLELTLPSHDELVPAVIAKLETVVMPLGLYDDMVWTQVAMALDEAILNAMIHGNLEVSSELRDENNGEAYWDAIKQRRVQAPYRDRRTTLVLTATRSQAVFVIRDQGPGFNVGDMPDPTDPTLLESIGGRGLLLINAFMDEVHYNDVGNELTMIKRKACGPRE